MSQPPHSRAPAPRGLLWVLPALALVALLVLSFCAPIQKAVAAGSALTPVPPVVSIDDNIPVPFGAATVAVPVKLTVGTEAISAMAFSIDFDEQCLSFSTADVDQNGMFDAVVFTIPAGFSPAASYSAADTDGELDLWIIDYSPPYATMASGTFVTLTFGVTCAPLPGQPSRTIPLLFSTNPTVSFGNPLGKDVLGESDSGSLLLIAPATLTPTLTPTVVPSETPTVVPSETPTVVPSETPTVVPSETPTEVPSETPTVVPSETPSEVPSETPTGTLTPGETPSATPTATSTVTPTSTSTSTPTSTPTATPTRIPVCEDGDGISDEPPGDLDDDDLENCEDPDDDGDGVPTAIEGDGDPDGDGVPNYRDLDSNNNGIPDEVEVGADPLHPVDSDGDGTADFVQMPPHIYLPIVDGSGG